MKKKEFMKMVLFSAVAVCLTSCAMNPKVTADLMGTYPQRSADQVVIYEEGDTVPANATVVGKVKVTDGGMTGTLDCLYGNVLALAVKKTAESGGNALHIDNHKQPDFASTCHRIWGTMLLLPDSLVKNISTMKTLQELEKKQDEELLGYIHDQENRAKRARQTPRNIFKVNGGVSFLSSDYQIDYHTYKGRTGYTLNAAYQHLWGFIGAGVDFSHTAYSFDEGVKTSVNFIGPSLVFSTMLGNKSLWRWDLSMSLGYGRYSEKVANYKYSEGHFCAKMDMGIEYKVAKNIGLGLQVGMSTLKLDKPEGYELKDNEFYGIQHVDILGGLRFYF